MQKKCTRVVALVLAFASLGWAGQKPWGFDPNTGEGGANKADVERALGHSVSYEEAQSLVFTCIDTVDGCTRERPLRTMVRTGGNGQKVTGYWFFGYETQSNACGSSAAAGPDATLHVNGIPID